MATTAASRPAKRDEASGLAVIGAQPAPPPPAAGPAAWPPTARPTPGGVSRAGALDSGPGRMLALGLAAFCSRGGCDERSHADAAIATRSSAPASRREFMGPFATVAR